MGTDLPSSDATIRDRALALFVQKLERRLSPATWWRERRWSQSPEHRQAYQEIESLWNDLGVLFKAKPPLVTQRLIAPPRARSTPRVRRWQAAAMVVMLGVLTSTTVPTTHPAQVSILTDVGQWAVKQLEDGTTAHIGPATRIEVSYDTAHRNVELIEGEAWFNVAKDAARPFVIDTTVGTIRATGTVFGVTRRHDETIVTVAEGTVAVSNRAGGRDAVMLNSGQQMLMTERGSTPPRFVNAEREFAWARGEMINVTGMTVEEVARDLNERNRLKIRVEDPKLAGMKLPFLAIRGNDPDMFLHYMGLFGSIQSVPDGRDAVRLEYMKPSAR